MDIYLPVHTWRSTMMFTAPQMATSATVSQGPKYLPDQSFHANQAAINQASRNSFDSSTHLNQPPASQSPGYPPNPAAHTNQPPTSQASRNSFDSSTHLNQPPASQPPGYPPPNPAAHANQAPINQAQRYPLELPTDANQPAASQPPGYPPPNPAARTNQAPINQAQRYPPELPTDANQPTVIQASSNPFDSLNHPNQPLERQLSEYPPPGEAIPASPSTGKRKKIRPWAFESDKRIVYVWGISIYRMSSNDNKFSSFPFVHISTEPTPVPHPNIPGKETRRNERKPALLAGIRSFILFDSCFAGFLWGFPSLAYAEEQPQPPGPGPSITPTGRKFSMNVLHIQAYARFR